MNTKDIVADHVLFRDGSCGFYFQMNPKHISYLHLFEQQKKIEDFQNLLESTKNLSFYILSGYEELQSEIRYADACAAVTQNEAYKNLYRLEKAALEKMMREDCRFAAVFLKLHLNETSPEKIEQAKTDFMKKAESLGFNLVLLCNRPLYRFLYMLYSGKPKLKGDSF